MSILGEMLNVSILIEKATYSNKFFIFMNPPEVYYYEVFVLHVVTIQTFLKWAPILRIIDRYIISAFFVIVRFFFFSMNVIRYFGNRLP